MTRPSGSTSRFPHPARALAGGLALLVALLLAADPVRAAEEVKIGVLYPLSGSSAAAGKAALAAVEAAVDVANGAHYGELPLARNAGLAGLANAKVRLVVADTGGEPVRGRREAERLIAEEGVVALLGAYHSSVTAAASAAAERAGIPFLTGESSAPGLTRRGFRWFFRTGPHDGRYSKVMFDFLEEFAKRRGTAPAPVAILHEDSSFGVESGRVQSELAHERGVEEAAKLAYRAETTSLVAQLVTAMGSGAKTLLPTAYSKDALLMMRTVSELGWAPEIVLAQNAGFMDPAVMSALGPLAEGIISLAPFASDLADRRALIEEVDTHYRRRSGGTAIHDPPIRGFVGALVLLSAIDRAGSSEPEAIHQALRETFIPGEDLPMPWRHVRFDPDGQNDGVTAILVQYRDGAYHTIYPFDMATREVLFPYPAGGSE